MIDAWSMRNWIPGEESGHDHFFATFDKFLLATQNHTAEMIAEAASHAAESHLQYVELMHTADGAQLAQLGAKTGWDEHLPGLRDKLLARGLREVANAASQKLARDESKMRSQLKCDTPEAKPGCEVTDSLLVSGAARFAAGIGVRANPPGIRAGFHGSSFCGS